MNIYYGAGIFLIGLISTFVFVRLFLSKSTKTSQVFTSEDGTKFYTQKDCAEYNYLYKKLKSLYDDEFLLKQKKKSYMGISLKFLKLIKTEGFKDINALISNRDELKKLILLLDTSELTIKEGNPTNKEVQS